MVVLFATVQVHQQGGSSAVFEGLGRDVLLYLLSDLVGGFFVPSTLGVAASLDQFDMQMRHKRKADFSVVVLCDGSSQ